MRLARPGGEVALVGMRGARSCLDLTALWHGEVRWSGAYAYGVEEHGGDDVTSLDLAKGLGPEVDLASLEGPRFRLRDYREAISAARPSGRDGHVKVVFDLR